jgi:hypothetical protein
LSILPCHALVCDKALSDPATARQMTRWCVSCAPLRHCRPPSVRSSTTTCTPFASVPLRFRSTDRLSRSLPSYSTRESVNLSCICQSKGASAFTFCVVKEAFGLVDCFWSKRSFQLYHWQSLALTCCNLKSALALAGTLNEVAVVQQTTTAVELALKEHSTVLLQLRSGDTIAAELYQVIQVSICSTQAYVASSNQSLRKILSSVCLPVYQFFLSGPPRPEQQPAHASHMHTCIVTAIVLRSVCPAGMHPL